jgi:hypothetical protein
LVARVSDNAAVSAHTEAATSHPVTAHAAAVTAPHAAAVTTAHTTSVTAPTMSTTATAGRCNNGRKSNRCAECGSEWAQI